jgi:hypothetical protein
MSFDKRTFKLSSELLGYFRLPLRDKDNSAIAEEQPQSQMGSPGNAAHLEPVTVTVSIPFSNVSWLSVPTFLSNETLSGTCVMPAQSSNPGDNKKS